MRLFVGVELDTEVARVAGDFTRMLRSRTQQQAPQARVSWIPEDRMHLTIRFIGGVDEAKAAAIHRVVEQPWRLPPFTLDVEGAGAFPPAGKPRVLWAGLGAGLEQLQAVERETTRRLQGVGVPAEERPYRPHLTLGRVKEPASLRPDRLFEGLDGTRLGTTHVEAITLFESRLSPAGPTYVPLVRARLVPPD